MTFSYFLSQNTIPVIASFISIILIIIGSILFYLDKKDKKNTNDEDKKNNENTNNKLSLGTPKTSLSFNFFKNIRINPGLYLITLAVFLQIFLLNSFYKNLTNEKKLDKKTKLSSIDNNKTSKASLPNYTQNKNIVILAEKPCKNIKENNYITILREDGKECIYEIDDKCKTITNKGKKHGTK